MTPAMLPPPRASRYPAWQRLRPRPLEFDWCSIPASKDWIPLDNHIRMTDVSRPSGRLTSPRQVGTIIFDS